LLLKSRDIRAIFFIYIDKSGKKIYTFRGAATAKMGILTQFSQVKIFFKRKYKNILKYALLEAVRGFLSTKKS